MKLTKKLEAEVKQVMNDYWESYFKGDLEHWATYLVKDYRNIGGTEEEIWNSKKEILDYTHRIIDQMEGVTELRNKQTQIIPYDPYVMVHELLDIYIKIEGEWTFYQKFRLSSLIQKTSEGWKVLHQHGSYPDSKTLKGEAFAFDEMKAENIKLLEAVKNRTIELEQKNRELEIETALEKVRAIALSMKEPADMLEVCKTISRQLESLQVNEIRNLQTAIINEGKGTYINYEYYAKHDKLLTTEVDYKNHELQKRFANQMLAGAEELFTINIEEKELKDWYAYQKTTNQFADTYLKNASSLNYYWFSLGPVALGLSAYVPLKEDEIILFKRFRNVFELAYRRFIDIEKAEAQAREAEIELALERVRSRSLAMHNTSELQDVINAVHKEFLHLNIAINGGAFIAINSDIATELRFWGSGGTADTTEEVHLPRYEKPFYTNLINRIKSSPGFFTEEYTQKEKKDFFTFLFKHEPWSKLDAKQKKETLSSAGGYTRSCCVSQHTSIFIINHYGEMFSAADNDILKRFGKTFEQTYTRFLDLQKAEAQAREAQIETALERVRSRSLAMHKSDELNEVVTILFEKLKELEIPVTAVGIGIYIDGSKDLNAYVCGENKDGLIINNYRLPYFHHKIWGDIINTREKQLDFFIGNYSKEEKNSFYEYLFEHTPELRHLPDDIKSMIFESPTYTISMMAVNNAWFNINDFEGKVLSGNEVDIIKRFARVFDQAYTRFLDLQNAEAQTREAQIEAALERVRSRSMAMHNSNDLLEVIKILSDQLLTLGLKFDLANFAKVHKDGSWDLWNSTPDQSYPAQIYVPYFNHRVFTEIKEADDRKESFFTSNYTHEEKNSFFKYIFENTAAKNVPDERKQYVLNRKGFFRSVFLLKNIWLSVVNYEGIPFTDDENTMLQRFAYVFEQAYTRFLDLQKAEAQAREAQIEVSLERVRSRAMAMHKTDELLDAAELLYKEITGLGIISMNVSYAFVDEERKYASYYGINPVDGKIPPFPFVFPHTATEVMRSILSSWKKQEPFHVVKLNREATLKHQTWVGEHMQSTFTENKIPFSVEAFLEVSPQTAMIYTFNFVQGYLFLVGETSLTTQEEEMLLRFTKVFEMTYRRFLDLKQAEAQAREAQIELGLERVRARAMAMQKSDELAELVDTVFKELTKLDFALSWCMINVIDEPSLSNTVWGANPEIGKAPESYHMLFEDYRFHHEMMQEWKARNPKWVFVLKGTEKEIYDEYLFNKTEFRRVPEAVQNQMRSTKQYVGSFTFSNFGGLQTISEEALSDSSLEILQRFGKVFDLTYTRFNDLQKAETQAREATIDLALERVRSQAMAMQKSSDLLDIVVTMRNEFTRLGHEAHYFWHMMWLPDKYEKAMTSGDGTKIGFVMELPRHIHGNIPLLAKWEKSKKPTVVYAMDVKEALDYVDKMISLGDFQHIDPQAPSNDDIRHIGGLTFIMARTTHGEIGYSLPGVVENPPKEDLDILVRFAGAFDIAHRRFLDLQKSEAQSREVEIELALEKVRSRSMGMQKSEELKDAIKIVYQQLTYLKIKLDHAGFVVDYTPGGDWHFWIADEQDIPSKISLPYFESVWATQFNEAKEKARLPDGQGSDFFATNLNFEEKNKFYKELLSYVPGLPEASKDFYLSCPGLAASTVLFDDASLYIENFSGIPFSDEENKILMRFGKVFQQTYTRFLDLQKAEAQAREAMIENALEKVRSRTMAMQRSDELSETAAVLFQEFKKLGEEDLIQITIGIYHEAESEIEFRVTDWAGGGAQVNRPFSLSMNEPTLLRPFINAWKEKKKSFTVDLSGEALEGWLKYRNEMTGLNVQSDDTQGRRIITCAFFSKGHLSISKPLPLTEDTIKLLERFAAVFDGTYTRFLDLKKAEAQAREAQIETGLEKVRSRTLAMQQSDELADTSIVIFEQLINLGIEPNRLFIGIIEEKTQSIEAWATNEDGTKIGNHFTLNTDENESVKKMYEGWKNKKTSTTIDMQGAELQHYFHYLADEMHIPFQGGLSQKRRVQTIAYFGQGLIGMASPEEQPAATTQLLERFAAVFNLTYTRFNDLKVAEAHALQADEDLIKLQTEKKRAEDALTELKSTQTQLIQSEKMASLGELTAGIAHEIQNPLNFVNNFSEVSKELLDEMKDAIAKGDTDDAIEIMNDVIENLEKINHHGKRADGIVKGMLQHSRNSGGVKEPTDINALCDEYLRLSYHGLRAKDKSFNATMKTEFDKSLQKINIIPQDIGRVVLNLINNAFYAVDARQNESFGMEKKKLNIAGYEPTVTVSTSCSPLLRRGVGGEVSIRVSDNGNGIPDSIKDKIFQPFFTTKPTGQGTGLGLSLSYDIIKAHGGELQVETKEAVGSTFIVSLPVV